MAKHVFISYSHKDEKYVAKLYDSLRKRNLSAWRDSKIDYGDRWDEVIEQHLESSAAVILVMSEHSKRSKWVKRENAFADRKGLQVLPLLLSGEPWLAVETTQYADVRDGRLPPEDFYRRLRKVVSGKTPASGAGPSVVSDRPLRASDVFRQSYQEWTTKPTRLSPTLRSFSTRSSIGSTASKRSSVADSDYSELAMGAGITTVAVLVATIVGVLLVPWLASLLGEMSFSRGWPNAVAGWSGWLTAIPLLVMVVGFVMEENVAPFVAPWVIALAVAVLELWLFPDLSGFVTVAGKTVAMGLGVLGAMVLDEA